MTAPDPAATADPNAALRAELRARLWNNRVPPHITTEVARRQFDHFLAKYPHAVPEIIAIELIRRVDQWDEIAAIQSVLSAVLKSSTKTEEGGRIASAPVHQSTAVSDIRGIRAVEQAVRNAGPDGLTESEILHRASFPTLASLKAAVNGAIQAKLITSHDLPGGSSVYILPESIEA